MSSVDVKGRILMEDVNTCPAGVRKGKAMRQKQSEREISRRQ